MLKKASVLLIALGVLFSGSAYAYDVQLGPFKDEENDYSKEPIYMLSALGIINGYDDRTYRPNDPLTREAFIKLLVLANRLDTGMKQGGTPADVAANRWSAPYVAVAYEREWID
ncbi:MAG: S-layer homology domain-containing protein, partial [Cohnella sp.]|nr:S-layer homology domain-containing protein [Cohnella sp.]